jgi:uncharacterized protein DUF6308
VRAVRPSQGACRPSVEASRLHAIRCSPTFLRRLISKRSTSTQLARLFALALDVPGVLSAVATNVLQRKRRRLIPMLDSVVVRYYAGVLRRPELLTWTVEKHRGSADATLVVLQAVRSDFCR